MLCCCQNHSIVEMNTILSVSFHRPPDRVAIRWYRWDPSKRYHRMATRSGGRWKLTLNMVFISTMEWFWQQQSMVFARESYRKILRPAKVISASKSKTLLHEPY